MGKLYNVVTVQTESLANVPSLDSLTDEECEQVESALGSDESEHVDPN